MSELGMGQVLEVRPRNLAFLVGAAICVILWLASQDPLATSRQMRLNLAQKFKFERYALPRLPGSQDKGYRDVAPSMGRMPQWISALSSGATLADLDGDGIPNDLLYTDNRTEQLIVTPAPGSTARYKPFELVSFGYDRKTAGPAAALIGDFNEDGWPDILVTFAGRTPLIFLRKPPAAGTTGLSAADFTVSELVPGSKESWGTSAMLQADLDGDGHPDIVCGNYFPDWCNVYDPKEKRVQEMHNNNGWACNGGGLHFFLWKKATQEDPHWFREVKDLLPERVLRGWTLAIGAQDLDGDLLPELYVGNDLGPDRLLHNRSTPGNLKFDVVEGESSITTPGSFVMGQDKYKGMACDFADLNGDGIADIFVSNVACEYALQESHFLWMSRTDGPGLKEGVAPYVQDSERMGVSRGGWGWDAKFESFLNQVTPDLLQARGFIKGTVTRWPEMQSLASYNSAFLKDPRNWPSFMPGTDIAGNDTDALYTMGEDGRYHDVGMDAGLEEPMVTRGVATADVDGNGRVEFTLANMWGQSYHFKNVSPKVGHYVGLRLMIPMGDGSEEVPFQVLKGRPPVRGRAAYGAVATIRLPCGRVLRQEVDGGNGHTGHRSAELHFGLGDLDPAVTTLPVTLRWRGIDGRVRAPLELQLERDAWHTLILGRSAGSEVSR